MPSTVNRASGQPRRPAIVSDEPTFVATTSKEVRVLVVTNRPAVQDFFTAVASKVVNGTPRFRIMSVRPGLATISLASDLVARTDIAVIDPGLDPAGILQLCHGLRTRRPELPMLLVLCCPGTISPWRLRTFLSNGMSGALDLHATHEEVGRAIRAVIQGVGVLRLQVASDRGESFCGFFSTGERHGLDREMKTGEINLLSLLTQGLSNREISRAVKLSSHTVKHYLEDLREAVGARNRVELAAWAARQGFYQFRSWQ